MIYFDNAATSLLKPKEVKEAIIYAMDNCGNSSRGAHGAALAGLRTLMEARTTIAQFFGVASADNIAFTANATTALNIAINSIHGHIVSTAAEHNSVLRPLYRQGNYSIVPLDGLGRLDINQLEAAIRPDTEAIVMSHASNVTGNVFDLKTVSQICDTKGIKLIVDASQSAGLIPINMTQYGLSALCFSGHKSLFGPQGTGAICLGANFRPVPLVIGGSGSDSLSHQHPLQMPDRLEAGTQNIHSIAGLTAGINYIQSKHGTCFTEADQLARYFVKGVQHLKTYKLYGDLNAPLRTPVVAINHPILDSGEIAHHLTTKYDIAVRTGAHCAPLMHKALGTEQTSLIRFSFSHLNSQQEVDYALEALERISQQG